MKVFLTGGTGFIGSYFINQAHLMGYEVVALKHRRDSVSRIPLDREPKWINKSMVEVTAEDFEGVDALVHLAAHSTNVPYDTLENCIQKNVLEPISFLKTAIKAGVSNFIIAGSCFEYGDSGERYEYIPTDAPLLPTQTYPASKALSYTAFYQLYCDYNVSMSYNRIFQVYGEGELHSRLWPSLKRAALSGEDFKMTKGEQVRDFVHVKEVAKHFTDEVEGLKTYENKPVFLTKNVGSGKPQSILEFATYWWEYWDAKGKLLPGTIDYRDNEVMRYVPEI